MKQSRRWIFSDEVLLEDLELNVLIWLLISLYEYELDPFTSFSKRVL